ncbi:MAG: ABC transporter ATP-binding protein [Patescibacteria group bacterium]|nr:ABC transporter ATP-binding protein [Patescibacteria group bacterium]
MSLFGDIFKYIWPQMRKYASAFYVIIIAFSLRVFLENILRPLYFKKIIDILSTTNINHILLAHSLMNVVFIIIGISIIALLLARIFKFVYYSFEINVMRMLRNYAFQKIENHSPTFFTNTFAGSLVTKSRRFVGAFETMFDIFLYDFLNFFIILVGVFYVLTRQSLIISIIFISWIIIHISVVSFFVKKKIKYDLYEAEQDSKISGRLADVFSNILAVKFFSARKNEVDSFKEYTDEGAIRSKKAWFFAGRIDIIQGVFIFIIQSAILYLMITLWIKNQISTGTVVLIQTYMVIVFDRLWNLGNSLTKFMKSAADMKEMIDIFNVIPDILDPQNPEILQMKQGHLVFSNVNFTYKNGQKVFNNFNIDIKPGERIGIVGHSGAGKSTFTNLILRFSDVDSGAITIDGQNIKSVTQDDLRSAISYVPQESILFHRTIRENIAYGKLNATEEEIKEVAKKAHAHEFIEKLPYKYDTYVGERGVKLSGGERQRIAIARAMIKDAPILILDEATSSLDSISEQYIQQAFNELMNGKTTIVIAHRLSTIQKMDRIIVFEDGKISEEGTHNELISKNGNYANLWNHQIGGFIME